MYLPKTCFAGRIIIREDRLAGLEWSQPCPVPPEEVLPFEPPMYFCVQHYGAAVDSIWDAFDEVGLVDHGIVAGPRDEFDRMMEQLGMWGDEA
jgi:hypothetical protein